MFSFRFFYLLLLFHDLDTYEPTQPTLDVNYSNNGDSDILSVVRVVMKLGFIFQYYM